MTGVGAALLLVGVELVVRSQFIDPGEEAIRAAERAGDPFDPRSRAQVVADLRGSGVAAVPRVLPAALLEGPRGGVQRSLLAVDGVELLPLAGVSNRTTVLCNETGRYAIFQSDTHGFRNPANLWDGLPVESALLGDSFTIGECVAPGQTIADGLRREWPRTVNLGYSGNSPLIELATLAEYGPTLRPRTTLWLYFENDLSWFDLGRSARSPLLMRYLEPGFSQSLIDRQSEIDELLTELIDAGVGNPDRAAGPLQRYQRSQPTAASRLGDILLLRRTRTALGRLRGSGAAGARPPDYPLLVSILTRAQALTRSWNGELAVVFLPGVWHFDSASPAPSWARWDARDALRDDTRQLGVPFIDLRAAFEDHPDPLSLYSYRGQSAFGVPHMNEDGYAFVARRVLDALDADRSRPKLEGSRGGDAQALSPDRTSSLESVRRSQISRQKG